MKRNPNLHVTVKLQYSKTRRRSTKGKKIIQSNNSTDSRLKNSNNRSQNSLEYYPQYSERNNYQPKVIGSAKPLIKQ